MKKVAFGFIIALFAATPVFAQKPPTPWDPAHSSNYSKIYYTRTIKYVIIHTIEGSAAAGRSWFKNPCRRRSRGPRAQALSALTLYGEDETLFKRVSGFLKDKQDVRLATIDVIGNAAPAHRTNGLKELGSVYAGEPEMGVRALLLMNILKLGRMHAIDMLTRLPERSEVLRQEIRDYLALLASGETAVSAAESAAVSYPGFWDDLQSLRRASG